MAGNTYESYLGALLDASECRAQRAVAVHAGKHLVSDTLLGNEIHFRNVAASVAGRDERYFARYAGID
jgi:hypothetical protein